MEHHKCVWLLFLWLLLHQISENIQFQHIILHLGGMITSSREVGCSVQVLRKFLKLVP